MPQLLEGQAQWPSKRDARDPRLKPKFHVFTVPNALAKVESLTNQEEVELRAKIGALGLEVTKVPSKSSENLNELEIAKELDKLSSKLDDVDEMISSAMAEDPQVQELLSSTAELWMPVIMASTDERRNFTALVDEDGNSETQPPQN
ncbi:hypothetical protein GIB67_016877 [Kingdonia uniflora]|uniref:Uncharacterized protein n=1 Tax=Kingdonia uniflora TaxID=39325 RepID=A0A7J7M381_9MAGN|nr:hypothetical protein GIB67_016877 [Kingdonia uniflora]